MKIKTGTDIIEVNRIKESIEKFGNSFKNRVFTAQEIEYCEKKNINKFQSYAGRFAAKEAVFKALSEYIDNKFEVQWTDIEVINDENGRPFINLYGEFEKKVGNNFDIDISISHVNQMAVASAVAYLKSVIY